MTREELIKIIDTNKYQCGLNSGQVADIILEAIKHDGKILTADGVTVKDGETVWMVTNSHGWEVNWKCIIEGTAEIYRGELFINVKTMSGTPDTLKQVGGWPIFARYSNARAKLDELMNAVPEPMVQMVPLKDAIAVLSGNSNTTDTTFTDWTQKGYLKWESTQGGFICRELNYVYPNMQNPLCDAIRAQIAQLPAKDDESDKFISVGGLAHKMGENLKDDASKSE